MRRRLTRLALAMLAGLVACTQGDLETLAERAVAGGRFEEARGFYRRLAARDPANDEYLVWIGRLSAWLEDFDTADVTYNVVLQRDPEDVEALVGKGYVAIWQGRHRDAQLLLRAAKRVAPHDAEVELAIARCYRDQGRLAAAARLAERLAARAPDDAEVRELRRAVSGDEPPAGMLGWIRRAWR